MTASHFTTGGTGLPVVEGKHIEPFRAGIALSLARIRPDAARRLLDATRTFERPRLAYRDVSSPTNRLTLIAAVIPPGCVTVHTLFCLRSDVGAGAQHFLCGIFNSLIANYFVRFWVSSHVTTGIVGRLPVPPPAPHSPSFRRIAALARTLSRAPSPSSHPAYARLQGEVARLYGVTDEEFARVLASFPLLPAETKEGAVEAFRSQQRGVTNDD